MIAAELALEAVLILVGVLAGLVLCLKNRIK
jgi:hypothetical protein